MLITLGRRPPFVSLRRGNTSTSPATADPRTGAQKLPHAVFQERFARCVARLERDESVVAPAFELLSAEISGVPMVMPFLGERGGIERRFEVLRTFHMPDLFLRHQLAGRGVYLDVGANVGLTSVPHAILGGFDGILAIEPEPLNFDCLRYNVASNGIAEHIGLLQAAVGESGRTALLKRRTKSGSHFLRKSEEEVGARGEFIEVIVRTVDDIAAELPRPVALVKCDTQGYEGHVLAGARGLLRERRAPWIVEFWPAAIGRAGGDLGRTVRTIEDSFSWFADCRRPGPGLLPIAEFARHVPQAATNDFTDYLLVP